MAQSPSGDIFKSQQQQQQQRPQIINDQVFLLKGSAYPVEFIREEFEGLFKLFEQHNDMSTFAYGECYNICADAIARQVLTKLVHVQTIIDELKLQNEAQLCRNPSSR